MDSSSSKVCCRKRQNTLFKRSLSAIASYINFFYFLPQSIYILVVYLMWVMIEELIKFSNSSMNIYQILTIFQTKYKMFKHICLLDPSGPTMQKGWWAAKLSGGQLHIVQNCFHYNWKPPLPKCLVPPHSTLLAALFPWAFFKLPTILQMRQNIWSRWRLRLPVQAVVSVLHEGPVSVLYESSIFQILPLEMIVVPVYTSTNWSSEIIKQHVHSHTAFMCHRIQHGSLECAPNEMRLILRPTVLWASSPTTAAEQHQQRS